jgi:hypothetical protein
MSTFEFVPGLEMQAVQQQVPLNARAPGAKYYNTQKHPE